MGEGLTQETGGKHRANSFLQVLYNSVTEYKSEENFVKFLACHILKFHDRENLVSN